MNPIESIPAEVAADMARLVNGLGSLPKDSRVSYGATKYEYVSLDSMLAAVKRNDKFCCNFNVSRSLDGVVTVTPVLTHISGYRLAGDPLSYEEAKMQAQGKGPQIMGSVITYCKRYVLACMLGVASDPDTDATTQEPERVAPGRKAEPATKQAAPAAPQGQEPPWNAEQQEALRLARQELPEVDFARLARDVLGRVPWEVKGGVPTEREADALISAAMDIMRAKAN